MLGEEDDYVPSGPILIGDNESLGKNNDFDYIPIIPNFLEKNKCEIIFSQTLKLL